MKRVWPVISLLSIAVVLYFSSLGLGYGYQTCSGGRVVERLPDGTAKRIVGPFQCSEPDYWPWLYVQVAAYAVALWALVLALILIRSAVRQRRQGKPGAAEA
ncbi:MAG TPA: hypothetical protein VJ927_08450 [Actinomycetota bacterium]|nr:hypothetical protein [Actinomycetota bacterium]